MLLNVIDVQAQLCFLKLSRSRPLNFTLADPLNALML